tara:strand:+ start:172 stop:459 length:288 start_codon:yes stop_codon:yes gene_type:complete
MNFEPFNRHIYVLPVEEKEDEDVHRIILPDDYNAPQSPYVVCDVLMKANDCEINLQIGDRILVERRMLHQINVEGETIYIVLQNYVYGRIDYEDN